MSLTINQPSLVPDPIGDLEFLRANIKPVEDEEKLSKKLAEHLDKVFVQNQKDFKSTRLEMVKILKRVRGEYDQEKLTAIKAFKGSEAYVRSAENKARAAESWIKDIYRGDIDIPWSLEPTAIPELPNETLFTIEQQVQAQIPVMQQQLALSGLAVDPVSMQKAIQDYYEEQIDKERKKLELKAKKSMERAAKEIRDQNQEAHWNDTFKDFLWWFVRLKMGIIKGPILTKRPKQVWREDPASPTGYSLQVEDVLVNDSYAVSPFNFYPSKGMRTVNDGDIIEIHELSKQTIADMIGVPGYSEKALRAVLNDYSTGGLKAKWFTVDDETAVRQVTKDKVPSISTSPPTQNSQDLSSDLIYAREFYGTISGKLLMDWGMAYLDPAQMFSGLDPEKQYQVNCWQIGKHVIKAVVNPDPLGRKPYHVSSWAKNPSWIVGEGLIEFAAPIEDAMNAVIRALINNVGIASGPMSEEDADRIEQDIPLHPWRRIRSTSMQMKNEGPAVVYYQPQMYAESLVNAFSFFGKLLDEMTVPAYAQGASQSGVTAGTATVFTQLLAAASRSIKAVVANIDDDIITPYITMCYDSNMRNSQDAMTHSDARVVAKGVSGLQMREQQAQRKVEYLQIAANPTYQQILGPKNLGAILAQIAKSNDLNLPDLDRIDGIESMSEQIEAMLAAQAGVDPMQANGQMANGGGAPEQPEGTNVDGSRAGVML